MLFTSRPPPTRRRQGSWRVVFQPVRGGRFSPSAAAVQVVHAGAATTRAALSARTEATGVRIAEADALYVENEAESAAKLDAVDPRVV